VQPITIAIDPHIKERFGPEVCWTWRLLLAGMGFPWKEVPLNVDRCDIAYTTDARHFTNCRLHVLANLEWWLGKANKRSAGVRQCAQWSHIVYEGEAPTSRILHSVDGRLVCERDIVFDVFWLATGQEERYWPRNQHGHFDLGATALQQEQALRLGLASGIGTELQKLLLTLGFAEPIPRWPLGKRAAACVSHDVDYPEVVRWLEPLRVLHRQGVMGLWPALSVVTGRRHHWHFRSWVELEQRLNIRAAFYFVARQGSLLQYAAGTPDSFYDVQSDRFRTLFKYLADEGCEIGLHASYHAFAGREKLATEKRVLENASGQSIVGNRHHYWHLNPDDPDSTLLIHEQIGLKYDTSLTHERYVGWRRGLSWPFFPFHQRERRELTTLQISTALMDDQLFGHRLDNPGERLEIWRALADTTALQGGCLLMDIHEYVFDDVLFPGWAKMHREFWEYLASRSDFWIDTPRKIASHWIDRHSSIVQASQGLAPTFPIHYPTQ
jgi:hypothetical protein